MSTTKHTPGPWTYNENFAQEVVGADGLHIAYVGANDEPSQFRTDEEHDANAILIAAAPELFQLIDQISRFATTDEEPGKDLGNDEAMDGLIARSRELIARAEGRA